MGKICENKSKEIDKLEIIETEERKRILTEKLEIDIIELPKIEGKEKERERDTK